MPKPQQRKKDEQPDKEELNILYMIDNKGGVSREELQDFAEQHSSIYFVAAFKAPFLVGAQIQKGSIVESRMNANETMNFKAHDVEDGPSLANAIYPFIKKSSGAMGRGVFSIGRTNDNDFVMNDFVISRDHAQIQIQDGQFSVTDLGSTNGTWVDARKVSPHEPTPIPLGAHVAFGRYEFKLISAKDLHELFHQDA